MSGVQATRRRAGQARKATTKLSRADEAGAPISAATDAKKPRRDIKKLKALIATSLTGDRSVAREDDGAAVDAAAAALEEWAAQARGEAAPLASSESKAARRAALEARAYERERRVAAERAAREERRAARARAEVEAARREAEAVAAEREQLAMAAEEERQRNLELTVAGIAAARVEAAARVAEVLQRANRTAALRSAHAPAAVASARSPAVRRALKSDVKRSTGLVKRVAGAAEEAVPSIVRDVAALNLSRYAGEVRSILCISVL